MSPLDFLKSVPNYTGFSRKSCVVLFAYYLRQHGGTIEFTSADIKKCFQLAMLKVPTDLADLIRIQTRGKDAPLIAMKPSGHFGLSIHGVNQVEAVLPAKTALGSTSGLSDAALSYLQRTIAKVTDAQRREFLAEGIACVAIGAKRATIVLSWIAAMDHMYEYVFTRGLHAFNGALAQQTGKLASLTISKRDELIELQESDFIRVCRTASLITKDMKKLMDEKLDFRNSCAHPSGISVGDSKVLSFVEDLVDNVFAKHVI